MRSLTALFETEKNKKTGAKPVWILKCPFVAGTINLSDRIVTIGAITYSSDYPTEQNDTYVKATTKSSTDFWPYYGTDPTKSLTGTVVGNGWISHSDDNTNQRVHFDLGSGKIIKRIYYENYHNSGGITVVYGVKNFTLWGSNDAADFADLIYLNDGTWTQITTSENHFDEHVASDVVDPKYITVTNTTTYRYYALKFADGYGNGYGIGFRRVELQELVPAPVTLPWIASWGGIDEDLSNQLTMPMVSDFSVDIIIDPDAATDIHDLLWSEAVETIDCELYLWFEGLNEVSDPPLLVGSGNIIDFERMSELVYNVRLVDEGVRIDKNPGNVLSLADYANASLDDVGYQLPILYGAVDKAPALRLDVGKKTSLIAAIDDNDVDFYLSDGTGFADGTHILIDAEEIEITTISANHITACARGHNSTTAVSHTSGALVLEKQATSVFMFADHPVKTIGNIYALRADGVPVDVTSICTKYTGQGGANDLAGYAGKAVCTCPGYITFAQAVSLGLVDTIGVSDDIDVTATIDSEATTKRFQPQLPLTVDGSNYLDASSAHEHLPAGTYSTYWYEITWFATCTTPPASSHTVTLQYSVDDAPNSTIDLCTVSSVGITPLAAGTQIIPSSHPEDVYNASLQRSGADQGTYSVTVSSIALCGLGVPTIDTTKTGAATKSGTVTVTGNQYADVILGDKLLISGEGYKDDGSGTFTGSASSLISRPDHIFKHFLYAYVAWPVADFSTDAATPFAADSYAFSVVMNTRKRMKEWLAYMALQCRCWFRFAGGKAYLLYRPDSISSDKTITAAMTLMNADYTTSLRITRSPLDEILNLINVYYQRDWTKSAGREAYQAVTSNHDDASIAAYGEKEKADTFLFDFVRDATMAADLRDFYLARYKDRKKIINGVVFLDNMEIEFADGVTFAALSNLLCEVRKVGLSPGRKDVNDRINLVAREY
jgi:hypothetical protein